MTSPTVKDLLLAPRLDRRQVAALLAPYGFKDAAKADGNLQSMAGAPSERQLLADILEELLLCASQSADADQALTYLERFAQAALNRTRLFSYLKEAPRTLELLIKTLGGSPYMSEILIRDPQHFYSVTDPQVLHTVRKKRTIQRELLQTLKVLEDEQKQLDYLRFFKRREMLHIGVRDLLRLCSVEDTLAALSILAEALISAAYWICASRSAPFTIVALGKLGGNELNFSSDVDLIYVYGSGDSEYFLRLSQKITAAINDFTGEGYIYRVDLRLRPEGHGSKIAYSLEEYERYYQTRLRTWERLALLKAWPVAGDLALGNAFLAMTQRFVYEQPFAAKALDDVRDMKRQIDQQMTAREQQDRNVKLGTGGIREIELIAQSLQVRFGGNLPQIRERSTSSALNALCAQSLISMEERDRLLKAYLFLRDVENKLQMVNDAQTHSLPRTHEELTACARLLGYATAETFLQDYQFHTGQVNALFEQLHLILSRQ